MTKLVRSDQWSKALFNNVHVLRVAVAIGNITGEVDCVMLQRDLSLGQPTVHRVLKVLEGVELLERVERTVRTEPLKYKRSPHAFWDAARQLMSSAEEA